MNDFEKYLIKSGDDRIIDNNLICNEHGFASYHIMPDKIFIFQCYGDGKHWEEFFVNMAREKRLTKIMCITRRNYKTFEKRFGSKKIGYVLEREVY